jgi:exodeoxyribonuclease VII large subunit
MPILTVTQINKYIGSKFREDKNIQNIMAKGEISDFVRHYRSGHIYFTLKDAESSIKAVMFSTAAARLKFTPENGMAVIISGNVRVYERDGAYQIYVNDMQPCGAGNTETSLEQLKEKLSKEGIFDISHKRPLPDFPKKIGAVTSISGAAIKDIINVLSRRYPVGELYIVNALVQGDKAADSICRGISYAESSGCDVIIVGRGGGSSEDLSAFNTEKVAYAIYNCSVPVISAVGHEKDVTISDLASDMRAATPSAAAELSSPSCEHLFKQIDSAENRIRMALDSLLEKQSDRYEIINSRLSAQSPINRLKLSEERLNRLEQQLISSYERYIVKTDKQLSEKIANLYALSPLKVMARGYSIVYRENEVISDSSLLKCGDVVTIRFDKGGIKAEIIE